MRLPISRQDSVQYEDDIPLLKHLADRVHEDPMSEPASFPFQTKPDHYSESYTANHWNDEYDKINNSREDGPNHDLEAFIIALMIWSDSTVLAQFGTATLWPIYLYIGNLSKYTRAKPTSMSAHHLAYLPKVCGSILYVFLF